MKKIRCPFGPESLAVALREAECYKLFDSPYIIKAIDSATVSSGSNSGMLGYGRIGGGNGRGGNGFGGLDGGDQDGSKTVYIILPFYPNGNLQDVINENLVTGNSVPEVEVWRVLKGVCLGLKAMHRKMVRGGSRVEYSDGLGTSIGRQGKGKKSKKQKLLQSMAAARDYKNLNQSSNSGDSASNTNNQGTSSEDQQQLLSDSDSIELIESSDDEIFDYEDPNSENATNNDDTIEQDNSLQMSSLVPYAHRDLKPANIMLADSNSPNSSPFSHPILMDLGSTTQARVSLPTRQAALALQDLAAEHCTLPYRAPELLFVKTGSEVDEKTDIWSLGCTIFALMYNTSPFEAKAGESGASLAMAIQSGKYTFPDEEGNGASGSNGGYSEDLKEVVRMCLVIDPKTRASVEDILKKVEQHV